jgi:hypothetical protein
VTERLNRLTDAYLDQALDKEMFESRKAALLAEKRALDDKRRDYETNRRSIPGTIENCVELAGNAYSLYKSAVPEKKRQLFRILMSNCTIRDKKLEFTWQIPFRQIAGRNTFPFVRINGGPSKEMGRTLESLIGQLTRVFSENPGWEFAGC